MSVSADAHGQKWWRHFFEKFRQNAQILKSRVSVSNFKFRVSVSEFLMKSRSRSRLEILTRCQSRSRLEILTRFRSRSRTLRSRLHHCQQLPESPPSRFLGSSPHWRCANTTGPHTLHWRPIRHTYKRPKVAENPPSRWVKSWGAGMGNMRRVEKATKRSNKRKREKKTKAQRTAAKAQRTEAKSSITRTSSDLAGHLISIGKTFYFIEKRVGNPKDFEEGKRCSSQKDVARKRCSTFEEGKRCSSHVSATATCKQKRPKQGERERPSKWHLKVTSMHMEERAHFGRIFWRDDITDNFLN